MLEAVNAAAALPKLRLISDYADHWALHRPDGPATIFGEERTSFAEFRDKVNCYARALMAAGIAKGDRVAVLSTPRPEFFIAFLATASIGGVWLGLNPRYTPGELARTLSDATPSVVLALASFEGEDLAGRLNEAASIAEFEGRLVVFGGAQPGIENVADFLGSGAAVSNDELDARRSQVQPEDPALIVYTSGSTGVPKGALLTHFGLCHAYTTQTGHFDIAGAGIICNLPVNHIGCLGDLCCGPMVGGGSITFMERFDPAAILQAIDSGQVQCLLGVPTMLQIISDLPEYETADFSQVRLICWGGAALPQNVLRKLRGKNSPLGVTYGMSEVPGSISMTLLGATDDELTRTVGRPTPGLEFRIVADDGRVLGAGEEGEVRVRHGSVLAAYFNRPDATAEAFDKEGFFRTGDVGVLDEHDNLRLVGRKKEMYKSGGYNVYPREIELCLEQHPDVVLAAVIGVPDALYQEVGHAYVIPKVGVDSDKLASTLEQWCRERLANYKRPKKITVSQELPLLPVGKVDKVQLKRNLTVA
jgi:acyl-CoA synthetase (AMP-forming)/AMP-acid ligase II